MLPRANLELSGAYYDLGHAYDGRCDVTCILLHSSRVILPPSFFPFYYVYNYVYKYARQVAGASLLGRVGNS